MQKLLGINDPEDTTPDEDVSPLTQLYGQDTPVAAGQRMAKPPTSASGGGLNETLANVLMGIGMIGGQAPPSFLTNQLRDSAILRRQQQAQEAILARQEAGEERKAQAVRGTGSLLSQALRLEAAGDLDGALNLTRQALTGASSQGTFKEALTYGKMLSDLKTQGKAGRTMEEIALQTGAKRMANDVFVKFIEAGKRAKMDPSTLNALATRIANDTETKEVAGNLVMTHKASGKVLAAEPIPKLIQSGKNLLRTEDAKVTGIAAGPEAQPGATFKPDVVIPEEAPKPNAISDVHRGLLDKPPYNTAETYADLAAMPGGNKYLAQQLAKPAAQQAPLPSFDQGLLLSRALGPGASRMPVAEIEKRWPNAGELVQAQVEKDAAHAAVLKASEQNTAMLTRPYEVSGLPGQAGHILVSKKTKMKDPVLTYNDVTAGKAARVTEKKYEQIETAHQAQPRLAKIKALTSKLLSEHGGENLGRALELYGRGILGDEDVRLFKALIGAEGLKLAVAIQGSRPTDTDAKVIQLGFPTETDTVKSGLRKLEAVIEDLQNVIDIPLGIKPMSAREDPVKAAARKVLGRGASGGF